MWWMLPAAAIILAVALVLAATVVPWLTGMLARRRESRFAAVRGDLGAAMVDLTEGAAELVAFGAAADQVRSRSRARPRVDGHRRLFGPDRRHRAGPDHPPGRAGLLGLPPGWDPGSQLGPVTRHRTGGHHLIPLAAFELVVGLPIATQALQRMRQAAARVFEVTDAAPPVTDPEIADPLPAGPYHLNVDSVWVGYPDAAIPSLRGMSLSLPAGRRVAILGPSGAGKSTLAAALVRFLGWQAGSITLGGTPIDRLTGPDLRTAVGLVGQDAYLFDATIGENLAVGKRDATRPELLDVLERVGLAGWLEDLPRGLGTEVGRHGARLSGGQRQRIAVARALLADFPVLILDEPAEHLDPLAADALTSDVLAVTNGRSLVLITHRLAGLESVDEILVMEAGRIVERGSHYELLDRGGQYSTLWWEEMSVERYAASPEGRLPDRRPPPMAPQSRAHLNDGTFIS